MPILRPTLRLAVVILAGLWLGLAAAPASAGPGVPLLRYVPDDVDMVASLNLAKARNTSLFRKGAELAAAELGDAWKKLEAAKVDPAKDLDTLLVAGYLAGDTQQVIGVFEGRLAGLLAELRKQPAAMQQGLEVWTFDDYAAIAVEKRVIVCSLGLRDAVIETVKGKRASLKASKRAKVVRAAVASVDPRGDAWVAVHGRVFKDMAPGQGTVSWLSASLATSKGMAVELKVSGDSEETASSWSNLVAEQLPMVKQLLGSQGFGSMADSIEAKNTGTLLVVGLVMSDGEVTKALSYLARQAGVAGDAKSP